MLMKGIRKKMFNPIEEFNTVEDVIKEIQRRVNFGEWVYADKEPETLDNKSFMHGQYVAYKALLQDLTDKNREEKEDENLG